MRWAKVIDRKGKISFKVSTPDPKAWLSLPDKPAGEIVRKLKLTAFLMVLGSQMTTTVNG